MNGSGSFWGRLGSFGKKKERKSSGGQVSPPKHTLNRGKSMRILKQHEKDKERDRETNQVAITER
jgi:hypothetical protein